MKDEIIILRKLDVPDDVEPKDVALGPSAKPPYRVLRLGRVKEDVREIPSIRQEKDVLAVAEAMPLRMYPPTTKAVGKAESEHDVWGLPAVGALDNIFSGLGATVAVLDTGIDRSHEAFEHLDAAQIVEDDFSNSGNGDTDGHGTHCAATIFGDSVGDTQVGIAPGISNALIGKIFGPAGGGSTATLAAAIDWAVGAGANVISMSCGIDYPGMAEWLKTHQNLPGNIATSRALEAYRDTVELFATITNRAEFARQPVIFVGAAGNASDSDRDPNYVVGLEPPAAAKGFISVAALGRRPPSGPFFVAGFSNGRARIAAPGVGIVSACAGSETGLTEMSGTSMAAPHVAGVALLWFEYLRKFAGVSVTAQLFRDAVIGSARLEGIEPSRIRDVGRGLVQAPNK